MTIEHSASLIAEREEFSESEKQLYIADVKKVCEEYFENCNHVTVDVTKCGQAFSVCVIFDCDRIKRFKKPL